MATWNNMNLQDSISPLMEQLMFFHDHAMSIIVMIKSMVSYSMTKIFLNNMYFCYMLNDHVIETISTLMPAIVLIFIAIPSLHLLYMMDDSNESMITIKTIGHMNIQILKKSNFIHS